MTVPASCLIEELFRVHNGKADTLPDVDALRELLDNSDGKALAVTHYGQYWPVTTEEGARVVAELIATFEEQT